VSLYNKYRPIDFEDMIGNTATIKSLQKIFTRDRAEIPQSFLFTGPSGCGKTTLAKIVKDELGCGDRDFIEMDTADDRGIEAIRKIRRNVGMKPISGDVRVWFLDECHMLTTEAENALLKTLESAPSHVYFILATTNPEKLLETTRNRCVTYVVDFLNEDEIKMLVKTISRKERSRPFPEVLDIIASDSLGSPRAALTMLEKTIGLNKDDAVEMARRVAEEQNSVIELCRALIAMKKWEVIARLITNLTDDPESSRRAILGYMSKVLLNAKTKAAEGRAYLIMDAFTPSLYYVGKPGLVKAAYEALYTTET